MKERPILFKGQMVRAILDGRKTQTRRVVKPQPSDEFSPSSRLVVGYNPTKVDRHGEEYPGESVYGVADDSEGYICPYGVPGDRLWVRETWGELAHINGQDPSKHGFVHVCGPDERCIIYREEAIRHGFEWDDDTDSRWRPSIHMPRLASRLTLEVVAVRVERLNEITCGDCYAEGFPFPSIEDTAPHHKMARVSQSCDWYRDLWDSINAAKHPWASNPWVWVVEFRRLEAPIAQ